MSGQPPSSPHWCPAKTTKHAGTVKLPQINPLYQVYQHGVLTCLRCSSISDSKSFSSCVDLERSMSSMSCRTCICIEEECKRRSCTTFKNEAAMTSVSRIVRIHLERLFASVRHCLPNLSVCATKIAHTRDVGLKLEQLALTGLIEQSDWILTIGGRLVKMKE